MLKMVYYVNDVTKEIEPFMQEVNDSNNNQYFMFKTLMNMFEQVKPSQDIKNQFKNVLLMQHYFDFLNKGYDYQTIDEILKSEIEKKQLRRYTKPLNEQRDILTATKTKINRNELKIGLEQFYTEMTSENEMLRVRRNH